MLSAIAEHISKVVQMYHTIQGVQFNVRTRGTTKDQAFNSSCRSEMDLVRGGGDREMDDQTDGWTS
jgi:hypothetical protein